MKILDELLNSLDYTVPVSDIRQGVFHTAVVSRSCGLASTLSRDAFGQEKPLMHGAGRLLERSSAELAGMARSPKLLEAAIGMAAINSLIEIDESKCLPVNAGDILTEKGRGKRVAIVGHFPFIPKLREAAGWLDVIEKNLHEGDLPEGEADKVLPEADVVGITGTAFTNHTVEHLLSLCRQDAFVLMLGDTTPLSPLLFDYGIDALCGVSVINSHMATACVSQCANFRQIKGLRLLTLFKQA